jgi:predicted DCC family thiol-disulfide oxidoreductase YuxK
MRKLIIFYDNFCPNCTKFSKLIQKMDWLKLIEIKQLRNESHTNSASGIDLGLAKQQMASFGIKWNYGYNSLYLIFTRLPLFWLFLPILFILKITRLGQIIYNELALKRKIIPIHCDEKVCDLFSKEKPF